MYLINGLKKWRNWNGTHHLYFSNMIVLLISIAFVVSDWTYSYFTFSEYILFFILAFFIFTLNIHVSKQQMYILSLLGLFLATQILLQTNYNSEFQLSTGGAATIKLMFYVYTAIVIRNYIKKYQLEKKMLYLNTIFAVVIILIGIYITLELYKGSRIPHEFFWKFTRRDIYSYYFESNESIVRARSLFSEPAHMGFYLNTIIAVNLFSKMKIAHYRFVVGFLVFGVLLSFSYSMIAIMCIIIFIKIIQLIHTQKFAWSKWMLLVPAVIGIVAVLFWDTINTVLIDRTINILTGKDISARMRLLDSWKYVTTENYILGNGLGHTPPITNIYAYSLSDLGMGGIFLAITASCVFIYNNWMLGTIFVLLNIAKGGYLSSSFWLMLLIFWVYSNTEENCK